MIPGVLVTLHVRTRNPLNMSMGNSRLAGVIKARERAKIRGVCRLAVAAALRARNMVGFQLAPWTVRLTRISTGKIDKHDGLGAALKPVIDSVADALGIDDGDETRLRFVLEQRKGKRGEHAVEVLLTPRGGPQP